MSLRRNPFTVSLPSFSVIVFSCEEGYDGFDYVDGELDTPAGTVTYQAEDRSFQIGCKEMSSNSGYTSRGFMDYGGNGTLVEWNNVSMPSAGKYTLIFRYANGSSGGDRRCSVTMARKDMTLRTPFFKQRASSSEPSSYKFTLRGFKAAEDHTNDPSWIILTALHSANTSSPVRDWNNQGCDGIEDSSFPSVYEHKGDMVLLSQSFDDRVAQSKFNAPDGTSTFGYVSQSDEAGFLFGVILSRTGETGTMKTHGDGASSCKDALVKPQ